MKKIILTFCFFLSACSIKQLNFSSTPVTGVDFKNEPAVLIEKFKDIENYHVDYQNEFGYRPKLSDLKSIWGEPRSHTKNWAQYIITHAAITSLGYFAGRQTNNSNLLMPAVMLGFSFSFNPKPFKIYNWEKNDYLIQGTFFDAPFRKDARLVHWEWFNDKLRSGKIIKRKQYSYLFTIEYSAGGEKIDHKPESRKKVNISDNTNFSIGINTNIPKLGISLKNLVGYEYTGFFLLSPDNSLSKYTFKSLVSYHIPNLPLNINTGFGYSINPEITHRDFDGSKDILTLSNAWSWITQIEYTGLIRNSFALKFEFLDYTDNDGNSYNGNNIGLVFTNYF